jgi:hypothetical protein
VQAIVNATNNNWTGFPFLFALCFAASVVIWFMDVEKGRENARKYAYDRKLLRVAKEIGLTTEQVPGGEATGELGVATGSGSDSIELVGVTASAKEKAD